MHTCITHLCVYSNICTNLYMIQHTICFIMVGTCRVPALLKTYPASGDSCLQQLFQHHFEFKRRIKIARTTIMRTLEKTIITMITYDNHNNQNNDNNDPVVTYHVEPKSSTLAQPHRSLPDPGKQLIFGQLLGTPGER